MLRHTLTGCFKIIAALSVLASFNVAWSTPSFAASGPIARTELLEARLISAADATGESETVALGLELKIKPGWKTYWRSPGDAGLPPALDWSASKNLKSAVLEYPKPQRFQLFGLQTFGYHDEIVFPLLAKLNTPGLGVDLQARLDVLVCEKICVPQTLDLTLSVPAGPATLGPEAQAISRFRSAIPTSGPASGLSITDVKETGSGTSAALFITASAREAFNTPDVIAELEPPLGLAAPALQLSPDGRTASFKLDLSRALAPGVSLAGRPVTITLIDGDRTHESRHTIAAGTPTNWASETAGMIVLALLGGLILNLMPCVLPVLSLKLMSFTTHPGVRRDQVRSNFLATAAGIITSMMVIAVTLIALKAMGLAIGWGIQFQQPAFVAGMALIVTLFAANLWGLYELILPSRISNLAGNAGRPDGGPLGHFAIGAFATLLATPCSAPFVGTAVGFAFAQGSAEIIAIFAGLGVGLAMPYLVVAAVPGVASFLPKPGPWMLYLRALLGAALAATAAWLVSVLAAQSGSVAALALAGLLISIVTALAIAHTRPRFRQGSFVAVGCLACAAIAIPALLTNRSLGVAQATGSNEPLDWVRFDAANLKSLVSQGKTVFVDVTASWCITCQANKKVVLYQQPILDRLKSTTVAMRADWTSPDPAITDFLARFGRYGIPLNVVFGPGNPSGVLLPEILTPSAVSAALDVAGETAPPPTQNKKSSSAQN